MGNAGEGNGVAVALKRNWGHSKLFLWPLHWSWDLMITYRRKISYKPCRRRSQWFLVRERSPIQWMWGWQRCCWGSILLCFLGKTCLTCHWQHDQLVSKTQVMTGFREGWVWVRSSEATWTPSASWRKAWRLTFPTVAARPVTWSEESKFTKKRQAKLNLGWRRKSTCTLIIAFPCLRALRQLWLISKASHPSEQSHRNVLTMAGPFVQWTFIETPTDTKNTKKNILSPLSSIILALFPAMLVSLKENNLKTFVG